MSGYNYYHMHSDDNSLNNLQPLFYNNKKNEIKEELLAQTVQY